MGGRLLVTPDASCRAAPLLRSPPNLPNHPTTHLNHPPTHPSTHPPIPTPRYRALNIQAGTTFCDTAFEAEVAAGRLRGGTLDKYSCVALAGVVTEYLRFGQAEGGVGDVAQLDRLFGALQVGGGVWGVNWVSAFCIDSITAPNQNRTLQPDPSRLPTQTKYNSSLRRRPTERSGGRS